MVAGNGDSYVLSLCPHPDTPPSLGRLAEKPCKGSFPCKTSWLASPQLQVWVASIFWWRMASSIGSWPHHHPLPIARTLAETSCKASFVARQPFWCVTGATTLLVSQMDPSIEQSWKEKSSPLPPTKGRFLLCPQNSSFTVPENHIRRPLDKPTRPILHLPLPLSHMRTHTPKGQARRYFVCEFDICWRLHLSHTLLIPGRGVVLEALIYCGFLNRVPFSCWLLQAVNLYSSWCKYCSSSNVAYTV